VFILAKVKKERSSKGMLLEIKRILMHRF